MRSGLRIYWSTFPSQDHPDSNEDAVLIDTTLDLVAVFDGVGGYEGGEVASRIAAQAVLSTWQNRSAPAQNLANQRAMMREALLEADRQVRAAVERQPELTGMATTAIVAKLWETSDHRRLLVHGHVGDSRLYLLHARGVLERVTVDDGILSTHVSVGLISEEEAYQIDQAENWQDLDDRQKRYFYQRGLITQAIGGRGEPEVHVGERELHPGDRVLVCSDGIHDNLTEAEITQVLRKSGRNDGETLVRAARERAQRGLQATMRSKPDDMSAIVIDVSVVSAAPKAPNGAKTQPTRKAPVTAKTQPTRKAPVTAKTQPAPKPKAPVRSQPKVEPKPKAPARPKLKAESKAESGQSGARKSARRSPQKAGSSSKAE